MMPSWVPAHREVILASGVAELVCALGMTVPGPAGSRAGRAPPCCSPSGPATCRWPWTATAPTARRSRSPPGTDAAPGADDPGARSRPALRVGHLTAISRARPMRVRIRKLSSAAVVSSGSSRGWRGPRRSQMSSAAGEVAGPVAGLTLHRTVAAWGLAVGLQSAGRSWSPTRSGRRTSRCGLVDAELLAGDGTRRPGRADAVGEDVDRRHPGAVGVERPRPAPCRTSRALRRVGGRADDVCSRRCTGPCVYAANTVRGQVAGEPAFARDDPDRPVRRQDRLDARPPHEDPAGVRIERPDVAVGTSTRPTERRSSPTRP